MGVGQRVESEVETEINAKPKQRGSVGLLDCLCSQRSLVMALSWKEGRQVDVELKLPILKLSVIDKYTFPKWSPSALLLKGVVVTWLSFGNVRQCIWPLHLPGLSQCFKTPCCIT